MLSMQYQIAAIPFLAKPSIRTSRLAPNSHYNYMTQTLHRSLGPSQQKQ